MTKILLITFLLFFPSFHLGSWNYPGESIFNLQTINSPQKVSESLGVKIKAKSGLIYDRQSKTVLFEKNAYQRRPIASLTKLMTSLLVLESQTDFNTPVKVSNNPNLEGADIDLAPGEEVTLKDLLYGTLISSGNDAATAMARFISGNNLDKFINQMNKKALEIGLNDTHFSNVTGLNSNKNFSTAYDLVRLTDYILDKYPFVQQIITTKNYQFNSIYPTDKIHHLKTTNELLRDDYPRVIGGKTGFTDGAGFCLVNLAQDKKGHQIITVVLGAEKNGQQFQDTKGLIDWTYKNFKWEEKREEKNGSR